jgi:hypothetical protein
MAIFKTLLVIVQVLSALGVIGLFCCSTARVPMSVRRSDRRLWQSVRRYRIGELPVAYHGRSGGTVLLLHPGSDAAGQLQALGIPGRDGRGAAVGAGRCGTRFRACRSCSIGLRAGGSGRAEVIAIIEQCVHGFLILFAVVH